MIRIERRKLIIDKQEKHLKRIADSFEKIARIEQKRLKLDVARESQRTLITDIDTDALGSLVEFINSEGDMPER
ncbi:hypothetical protein [Salicibibacter kimchii]|uniref:Uncharacterized protein n=1 Tax=Salicibibacter kimchii TaxID=2099786 RepID=A0A345BUI7_9BACI|nr:hypothetical protein [Salicibibacter kimchii]AXF54618.1 hypothetical protein DT065_00370 [Salicibibacter kimchii]